MCLSVELTKKKITLATSCSKTTNNEYQFCKRFSLYLFIKESKHCTLPCTFHYAGHTKAQQRAVIDPSTAALRAHWDFTLIDYFTIRRRWLLAGEASCGIWRCCASAIVHSVFTHWPQWIQDIQMQPVALKKLTFVLTQCTNTHPHCDCMYIISLRGMAGCCCIEAVRQYDLHTGPWDMNFSVEITNNL